MEETLCMPAEGRLGSFVKFKPEYDSAVLQSIDKLNRFMLDDESVSEAIAFTDEVAAAAYEKSERDGLGPAETVFMHWLLYQEAHELLFGTKDLAEYTEYVLVGVASMFCEAAGEPAEESDYVAPDARRAVFEFTWFMAEASAVALNDALLAGASTSRALADMGFFLGECIKAGANPDAEELCALLVEFVTGFNESKGAATCPNLRENVADVVEGVVAVLS